MRNLRSHAHNLKVVGSNQILPPQPKKAPEHIDVFGAFVLEAEAHKLFWESHGNHEKFKFGLPMTLLCVKGAHNGLSAGVECSSGERDTRTLACWYDVQREPLTTGLEG